MRTVRQLGRIGARVVAGVAVIAIIVGPIVVMALIAGNPFGGDLLDRIGDRRVDDATILRLLSIAFYTVWAWFTIPALRQAQQCFSTRTSTGSRLTTPGPAPADVRGPHGWLAQLVRYTLTTTTLAATLTASSTLMLATPVGSTSPARTPTSAAPVTILEVGQPERAAGRPDAVSEIVAQRRDTPYSMAARLFPDRVDATHDEILTLNLGRPTPDGRTYQGGTFPIGMTVLTQEHHQPVDTDTEPSSDGWLPAETVTVEPGDNIWNLATARLDRADGPDAHPTQAAIAEHVDIVIDTNIFPSGDPNLIFPGDTIEFPLLGAPPAATTDTPAQPHIETPPVAESTPPQPATPPRVDASPPPVSVTLNAIPTAAIDQAMDIPARVTAPAERASESTGPADDEDTHVTDRSQVTLAGITGAVVLASGLAATIVRQRRRRRARGTTNLTRRSPRAAEVATAIVAAADIPFVRWAGQELATLARQLDPSTSPAAPVAVELEPDSGIEVLWDQPSHHAPPPWEATDGGWSWRVLYDPDEPTPLAEWPTPIPALVTVGTRDGRQLLIDLEHVGTLAITGPRPDVDAWVRAVVLELGVGNELADAAVTTVGAGVDGVEHLERITRANPDEAVTMLIAAARDAAGILDGYPTLFHRRLGHDPLLGMWGTVVVCGDVERDEQARIAAAVPRRRGVAAIVTVDMDQAGARLVLDGQGAAVLHGIGEHPMLIVPVAVPRDTAAELAVLLDDEHRLPTDETATADLLAELDPTNDDNPHDNASAPKNVSFPLAEGAIDLDAAGQLLDDTGDEWQRLDPAILVRVLGRPSVPDHPELQGVRLRLLVFLACQDGAIVSTSRVRNAVWGGEAHERKTLSNKLSELRNALGNTPSGNPYVTVASTTGIQLHPSVMTDLAVFKCLTASHVASNEAIELLHDALAFVDGEPFDDGGYEWAEATQDNEQTHDHIVSAARQLYQLACDADDFATARFALVQGLKAVPGHEELYRLRMQLEHRASNTAAVHAAYNELTHQLTVLECEPSTETVSLYRHLVGRRP